MEKAWYVVQTYSGYEGKAKTALEERIRTLKMEDFFGKILVPSESVVEMVKGTKKTTTRKLFPGYVLIEMALNNETWHVVKNTPKVAGFVGETKSQTQNAKAPVPITLEELHNITSQMEDGAIKPKPKISFEKGETVHVVDGPFSNFSGIVGEVMPDKGKLRVLVSIFGRSTPVELEFGQVEKK